MSPQDSESARKRGCRVKTDVMLVIGAGQISMAIARRTGFGRKIVLGDKKMENAAAIAKTMNEAGFDVVPFEMDLSSRESILAIIAEALRYGCAAGGGGPGDRGRRLRCHHLQPVRLAHAPADR